MKIAMIFPYFTPYITGGAGGLLLYLAKGLLKKNHDVTIITTRIPKNWKNKIPSQIQVIETGRLIQTKNRDFNLLMNYLDAILMAKKIHKDFDIINVHNSLSPFTIAIAKLFNLTNSPVVYQCNEPPRYLYDLYYETYKRSSHIKKIVLFILAPILRFIDKWSVKYVDHIITISHHMNSSVKKIYHKNSTFIMPGIKLDLFNTDIDGIKIREKFATKEDLLILSSSVLHFRKQIDLLIKAISLIKRKKPNLKIKLVITGDGPEKNNLKKMIKDESLHNIVFLTGFIDEKILPKYYAACDVFAFMAIREPRGGAQDEALASGKPAIVPNEGGPAETIINKKTGFIYQANNVNDLADKIIYCAKNKEKLKKMKQDCRSWVIKHRSWDKMTNETIKIFFKIMQNK